MYVSSVRLLRQLDMRHVLSASLIALSLMIGATGAAPVAHAQAAADSAAAMLEQNFGTGATASGTQAPSENTGSSVMTDPALGGDTASQFGTVMTWIMSLFAWLVGVAALLLDYAVYFTVVSMGSYVSKITAIGVTWRILRDVANIMLIFGFLAIGVATILNVDWYGGSKKLLPKLVVAAVALNFSLFVCEAMIDGSNLIATQFYQQINGGSLPTMTGTGGTGLALNGVNLNTTNEPISNAIMSQLGLQTLYPQNNPTALKGDHTWFIGFMGIILFMVTAFVLFSLAFILIARFVALIFFILLSPIGFMGWALPLMQYRAGQWWSNFLEQIVTAPVLLLLLYVALAIITDAQFLVGFNASSDGWLGLNNANFIGFAGMLLSFLVAIGFLMVVVIKARSMSAFGAGWAMKTAGAATFGATAFGLRSTAGLGSQWASQAIRRSRFAGTKTGRVLATTLDKGATASFDVRGTNALKVFPGGGIDAGAPQKGGYRARLEGSVKAHEAYAGTIQARTKQTADEKAKINVAITEHAAAETEHGELEAAHKLAVQDVTERKAEVARLEAEEKERTAGGVFKNSPEQQRALDDARKNLATSEATLATASASLEKAAGKLATAAEAKSTTVKSVESAMTEKGQRRAYAESIQGPFFGSSVPGWAAFGPGGAKAAEKIKNAAKDKTQEQKLGDIVKKMAEEQAKELAKKVEEAKPASEAGKA